MLHNLVDTRNRRVNCIGLYLEMSKGLFNRISNVMALIFVGMEVTHSSQVCSHRGRLQNPGRLVNILEGYQLSRIRGCCV